MQFDYLAQLHTKGERQNSQVGGGIESWYIMLLTISLLAWHTFSG